MQDTKYTMYFKTFGMERTANALSTCFISSPCCVITHTLTDSCTVGPEAEVWEQHLGGPSILSGAVFSCAPAPTRRRVEVSGSALFSRSQ